LSDILVEGQTVGTTADFKFVSSTQQVAPSIGGNIASKYQGIRAITLLHVFNTKVGVPRAISGTMLQCHICCCDVFALKSADSYIVALAMEIGEGSDDRWNCGCC
jgi:hypothetical protein